MADVEIVPYNPEWPKWFSEARELLRQSLGTSVMAIDHIGSTSVPGLGSKNRIDMLLTVGEINELLKQKLDEKLTAAGFQKTRYETDHRPPGDTSPAENWKKLYLSGTNSSLSFRTNIHIRTRGMANHTYAILFRDYLRAHPLARDAYYDLKIRLAAILPNSPDTYSDIKDPACDLIMVAAYAWAKQTGWSMKLLE